MNVRARKAKEALKKAQRQHQKEVKEAHRQLEIASEASSSRSRKRQKTQKEPKKPDVVVIQPELEWLRISQSQDVVEPSGNQLTMVKTKLVDLYIVSLTGIRFDFSSIGCVLNKL
jgi:hypothetical protein